MKEKCLVSALHVAGMNPLAAALALRTIMCIDMTADLLLVWMSPMWSFFLASNVHAAGLSSP